MNVLFLNDYEGDKVVEVEKFDEVSCVDWIKKNVGDVSEWVEKDLDEIEEGGGCEEEDFGSYVLIGSKVESELKLIKVMYWMFCVEKGWIEVYSRFVMK